MTGADADLARLLAAFLHAHRRLLAYARTHLAVRESEWDPGGHVYLTNYRTTDGYHRRAPVERHTLLRSDVGITVSDPDGDTSEVNVEAVVRPYPTGFEVSVELLLGAGEQSTTGWPAGLHLLHGERRHCADVPEALTSLAAFVDRLYAIEDPLASVRWTRR